MTPQLYVKKPVEYVFLHYEKLVDDTDDELTVAHEYQEVGEYVPLDYKELEDDT